MPSKFTPRSKNGLLPEGAADAVLFIEDDHVLSPDAYRSVQAMLRLLGEAEAAGADAWGVALADISGRSNYVASPDGMHLFERRGGYSNTGYAFGACTWAKFEAARDEFDAFPDGWDWAMYHLQQKGLVGQEFVLPRLPRIRNIGVEGVNMDAAQYAASGLGDTVVSGDLSVSFRAPDARLIKGKCTGCDPDKPWAGTRPIDESSCWMCDLCTACLKKSGVLPSSV